MKALFNCIAGDFVYRRGFWEKTIENIYRHIKETFGKGLYPICDFLEEGEWECI